MTLPYSFSAPTALILAVSAGAELPALDEDPWEEGVDAAAEGLEDNEAAEFPPVPHALTTPANPKTASPIPHREILPFFDVPFILVSFKENHFL